MQALDVERELVVKTDITDTEKAGKVLRFRPTDTWKDIQELLAKARDLPIRRPPRPNAWEYHLEALLPPGLQLQPLPPGQQAHPRNGPEAGGGGGGGEEESDADGFEAGISRPGRRPLQITDEAGWQRLQRLLPSCRSELATSQLRSSASATKSAVYVRHLEGYMGMWEVAVASSGASPVASHLVAVTATTTAAASSHGIVTSGHQNGNSVRGRSAQGGGGGSAGDSLASATSGGSGAGIAVGKGASISAGIASEVALTPLDGVWSEEEVRLLVRCVAEFMRKGHLERVGAVSAGCCTLATLWWLLRQSTARVRPTTAQGLGGAPVVAPEQGVVSTRQGPGRGDGAELEGALGCESSAALAAAGGVSPPPSAPLQPQPPAAVFRLQLRRKERGGLGRSRAATDGRSGGTSSGYSQGASNTVISVLLSPELLAGGSGGHGGGGGGAVAGGGGGLPRALSVMFRDILTRVGSVGSALLRQYKGSHVALAALWGVGVMSEMLKNQVLRDEVLAAAQLGAAAAAADGSGAAGGSGSRGGGSLAVGGGAGHAHKRQAANMKDGGGSSLSVTAAATASAATATTAAAGGGGGGGGGGNNMLGIDLEELYWLLLGLAALPEWLEARSTPPWDLQPMGRSQAVLVIQSSVRGLTARRSIQKLRRQVSRVFPSFRSPVASPPLTRAPTVSIAEFQLQMQRTLSNGRHPRGPGAAVRVQTPSRLLGVSSITSADPSPPGLVPPPAPARPRGLNLKWEEEEIRMADSAVHAMDRYFDLPHGSHPGVAAAEALLELISHGGPLVREHLAASVHPGQIVRLLDIATVPPRTVHLGVVLLAQALRPSLGAEAFFRAAGAAAAAAAPGPPGSTLGPCFSSSASTDRGMLTAVGAGGIGLVLELLKWLAPLTALEAHERRLRYGASERRPYQGLYSSTRPYTPPPLVDWRWAGSGSEVAVHAAAAAWAVAGQLARLWGEAAAIKKAVALPAHQQRQQYAGGWSGAGAGGGTAGGGGGYAATGAAAASGVFSAASLTSIAASSSSAVAAAAAAAYAAVLAAARSAAGPQDGFEEAAHRLMAMTVTCLVSGRIGPATHLLVCGLVQLLAEPSAVPYMVRAGLVDAGQRLPDPPPPPPPPPGATPTSPPPPATPPMIEVPSLRRMPSRSAGTSMSRSVVTGEEGTAARAGADEQEGGGGTGGGAATVAAASRTLSSLPGFTGVAPHPRGVVGLLMDSDVPGFLDLALSVIGLAAQHGTPYDPIKGGPPGAVTAAASFSSPSWTSSPPVAGTGGDASGGGVFGKSRHLVTSDASSSFSLPVPDLDHEGIPARRLLMAGGWEAVCSCLAAGGGGPSASQKLPELSAAALMFLAKEVYLWSEVLVMQAARRAAAEAAARAAPKAAPRRRYPHRVQMAGPLRAAATASGAGANSGGGSVGAAAPTSNSGNGRERDTSYASGGAADGEDSLGLDPDLPCPPEVASLLRLLMGDDFRALTAALQVLTQLLGRLHARPLQLACLTAYHLAGVPLLRDPLGRAGIVSGLVVAMRRWYDLPPSEQRAFRSTGEWAMAALVRLTAEPGGERNRYRLASAHRDEIPTTAAQGAGSTAVKGLFTGFGYATSYELGATPLKQTGRTGDELVRTTKWNGGWGWGSRAGGPAGSGVEAARAATKLADDDDELARELTANDAAPRSASDPIGLLVQLTSLKSRSRSSYVHIKMPTLLLLRQFSGEKQYRTRLVSEGAGTALAAVASDPGYDGLTRAAAAALWMEVSQTEEGRDPAWWSAMAEQQLDRTDLLMDGEDVGATGSFRPARTLGGPSVGQVQAPASVDLEPARLVALSRMICSMLGSTEAEQQLVGARAAAGLLCEGDAAKSIFLSVGAQRSLLAVAGSPLVQPGVLAAVCTALLNLSSYVPAQMDMCQRCARLLLHINAKYTGYHGYLIAHRGLVAAVKETDVEQADDASDCDPALHGRRRSSGITGGKDASGEVHPTALPPSIQLESLGAVEEILYSSSGALFNLSRHPGNRDAFYRLELDTRTRGALAELAEETAAKPPPISGMSRRQAAVALLSGELRADMPLPCSPSRRVGTKASNGGTGRSDSGGDNGGSDEDGEDGGGGGAATAMWSINSASPFVPHHLRDDVVRYVSYTSYLQEVLSRPLHALNCGGDGGGGGGWGSDDNRSQTSAFTGGASSSVISTMGPSGSRPGSRVRIRRGSHSRSGSGEDTDADRHWAASGVGAMAGGDGAGTDLETSVDDADDCGASSHQQPQRGLGPGDPAFPRLATLTKHLTRPLSSLWAPLLVDRHDGMAMPLFGLRDALTGERLDSGGAPRGDRSPPTSGTGAQHQHQQQLQTHHYYASQQHGKGGAGTAASVVEAYANSSTTGGQSTATTITHLTAPTSATRWSPAVKWLRPVGQCNGDGNCDGVEVDGDDAPQSLPPPRAPDGSEPVDGAMTVRVEFEACGPSVTGAVVRNFRTTTAQRGGRTSASGGGDGDTVVAAGTRRYPANARPSTAPITRGAPAATSEAASGSAISRSRNVPATKPSRISPRQPQPQPQPQAPLGAVVSGGASSVSLGSGWARGGGGDGGRGVAHGNGGSGCEDVQTAAAAAAAGPPPASMIQQVATLVGSLDTSKADRMARDISFSLMSLPSSSLAGAGLVARARSRITAFSSSLGPSAGEVSGPGNKTLVLRPSVVLKGPERNKKELGSSSSFRARVQGRPMLASVPSFSAASVASGVPSLSAVSASLAPSAASAHDSSVFGADSYWEAGAAEATGGEGGNDSRKTGAGGGGAGSAGRFGCNTPAGQQQLRDFKAPRVTLWTAVPGSKISDNLYPTYQLETGEPVHMYRRRKDRVDELRPTGLPHSSAPDATAGSYQREEAAARDLLARGGEPHVHPDPPELSEAPAPPRPDHTTLIDPRNFTAVTARVLIKPRPGYDPTDLSALEEELRSPRARSLARSLTRFGAHSLVSLPALPPGVAEGAGLLDMDMDMDDLDVMDVVGDDEQGGARGGSWVGAESRGPSRAGSLRSLALGQAPLVWELEEDLEGADRPGMELELFDRDWSRCIVKPRVKHLITRNCPGGPPQVEDLRSLLREHYWWLLLLYHHYAALYGNPTAPGPPVPGSDPFALQLSAWATLVHQTGLMGDPGRQGEERQEGPPSQQQQWVAAVDGSSASPVAVPGGRTMSESELSRLFLVAAAAGTGSGGGPAAAVGRSPPGRSSSSSSSRSGEGGAKSGATVVVLPRAQWLELLLRVAAARFLQPTELNPSPSANRGGSGNSEALGRVGIAQGPAAGANKPAVGRVSSARRLMSANSTVGIRSNSNAVSRRQLGAPSRSRLGVKASNGAAAPPAVAAVAAAPAPPSAPRQVSSPPQLKVSFSARSERGAPKTPRPAAIAEADPPEAVSADSAAAGAGSLAAASVPEGGEGAGVEGGGGGSSPRRAVGRHTSVRWQLPEEVGEERGGQQQQLQQQQEVANTGEVGSVPSDVRPRTDRFSGGGTDGVGGDGGVGDLNPGSGCKDSRNEEKKDKEEDEEQMTLDLVSAVRRLLYECFLPNVAPGALVEPRNFRAARLWQPEVTRFFRQQEPLLRALYAYYRDVGPRSGAGSGSTSGTAAAADLLRMELTGWLDLLDEGRLLSAHLGVREATLAFSLSRSRYTDEVAAARGEKVDIARSRGLSYSSFLEALGRTAEIMSPPAAADLSKLGFTGEAAAAAYYSAARLDPGLLLAPRASAQLHAPKSRALEDKLRAVLAVVGAALMDQWNCKTGEQLLVRLRQPRQASRPQGRPRSGRAGG